MTNYLGSGLLRDGHQIIECDHLPGVGPYIELTQIRRSHARVLFRLHINPVRTVVVIEVVDIRRAHEHAQRRTDLAKRNPQRFRLFPVDGDQQLRISRRIARVQVNQLVVLTACPDDLVSDTVQVLQRIAAQIL